MRTKAAIANRILELCSERNIAINELANISGVSPSTVYSILNEKSQNPGAITIKKLCDGLEIKKTDARRVKTVCSEKGTTIAPTAALYRLTSFRAS